MLTRPMVTVAEPIGYLPGTVDEKTQPWLLPFHDVLGQITFSKWEEVQQAVEIEAVPVGMLRGRTIRDGVLVADEFQNATREQIICTLTRIGPGGRLIICGDPQQSDLFSASESPLVDIADRLDHLDCVATVHFDSVRDQLRDPLVSEILACL